MKTFKKALSIILGLAIMLSCVAGMQVSVAAEETALKLALGDVVIAEEIVDEETATTVEVPVMVESNPGFITLSVKVAYDSSVLKLIYGEKQEGYSDAPDAGTFSPTSAAEYKMQWAFWSVDEAEENGNADITATGRIATLKFQILDTEADATNITLDIVEAGNVAKQDVAAIDLENAEIVLKTAPEHVHNYSGTYDEEGHWEVCANEDGLCDAVTTEKVAHEYVDGFCSCGAEEPVTGPVVDDALVFAAIPSVVYGTASIEMAFRVENTVLAKYATTTLNLVENPTEIVIEQKDLVAAGTKRKQYYFKDLFLYELGLDVNYLLRGYDAEGNLVAVSETFTSSPATWLKNNIATSADAKFKTMATDTLVVCDEVVKSVATSYPNSDLAKATSVIEGVDLSIATQEVGEYNTIDQFVTNDANFDTASDAKYQVRTSAQTEKVTFINLRIKDANKELDLNKLVVNVNYTSKDSAGEHPRSYTYDADDFTWAGRYINVKFDQVGIHDSNKDILFEVVYDGVEVCEYTYSVETYLGANLSTTIGAMNTALMKLGQSFRSYQGL